jgi:hypothetical protein
MKCPTFQGLHRPQGHLEIAGEAARGFEIVVKRDHGVTEALAKMIDDANHAKWHATDPEAREDMQNVPAQQGGAALPDVAKAAIVLSVCERPRLYEAV